MVEKEEFFDNLKTGVFSNILYRTKVKLQTPSVTLPRIKTITSGDISRFADVIFNLKATDISEDNFIDILKYYKNFRINLYGDDTWIKLFPNRFSNVDLTTSFFVKDYYEVDRNVTRNIPNILSSSNDWDLTILHYLGLDHIGHVEGPFSSLIKAKIQEMESAILNILTGISKFDYFNSTLVIVTGDHGMSDLGGHGGASDNELTTAFMAFSQRLKLYNASHSSDFMQQNDIATSISLLTGVPIPSRSVGVISHRLLDIIGKCSDRSLALYSNFHHFINLDRERFQHFQGEFEIIKSKLDSFHTINKQDDYICTSEIDTEHESLIRLLKNMQRIRMSSKPPFDSFSMEIGLVLVLLAFINYFSCFITRYERLSIISGCLMTLISTTILFPENINICPMFWIVKYVGFIVGLCGILYQWISRNISFNNLFAGPFNDKRNILILFIPLIHFVSHFSSSFIEEEHQFWYFISTTFLLSRIVQKCKIIGNYNFLSVISDCSIYIGVLICDRALRCLNHTGDKWSHLPDIGDWLNKTDNWLYLWVLIGLALCTIYLCISSRSVKHNVLVSLFLMLIFVYRSFCTFQLNVTISDSIIHVCYFIILLQFGIHLLCWYAKRFLPANKNRWIDKWSNSKLSNSMILLAIMVARPHNTILFAGFVLKRVFLRRVWLEHIKHLGTLEQSIMFYMLGMVSFYQQGNSHSLATIDVQAGYVGLSSYQPVIIGFLLISYTWMGPLFWITVWLEWKAETSDIKKKSSTTCEVIDSVSFISSSSTLSLMLICSILKHHLFVWSVFTPRLLYGAFFSLILMPVFVILTLLHL